MSGRGRRAALPPTDYRKAPVLDADGLVIRPVSGAGKPLGVWDFRASPGPVDFRRALVAALAAQGRGWGSQDTYLTNASTLKLLFKDAAAAEPPVAATGQITVEWWKQWSGDFHVRRVLAAVVRRAPGVPEATRVFMERPRRRPPARRGRPRKQAHTREELRRIRDAAAATVRAGRLRIAANTAVLERWRAGAIERGDGDWSLGEVLDVPARTGDLPRYPNSATRAVTAYAERAFGFEGNAAALSRLFPTPAEIGAAAVLLIAHEAWNQSVLKKMDVPTWWPQPANLEECVGCGRRKPVANRLPDGPRCQNCRPRISAECGICGRTALCDMSRATGQPWCDRCQQRWVACSSCGTVAQARSGTWEEPLCAKCTNPDPDFWGRCPVCTITWQLSTRPCQRCVLDQQVRDLLGGPEGASRPELAPFHDALTGAERPDVAMAWIARSKARDLLERIGRDERPVTHEVLDELPAGKVLAHLRSVLVATSALPPRDERLVALEKWITATVEARTDLAERRILHGYAVWHHMRRLRRRLGDDHTTRLQDLNARCHVTAAGNFLDWLDGAGLTLGTCTQTDLERWMADSMVSYRDETGHFVRWSVQHRHARDLTYGTVRWTGPLSTIDSEKRWADARRLLNDDTLPTPDRVAGLLLILYAQKIATISQLTVDDVDLDGDTVSITFGTSPVVLPAPLATLVRQLVATRRGKAKFGTPEDAPWLFPEGQPGRPLGDDQIGQRLHKIGIRPKQDRSTALFTLATEVPAAILARMLGVHIKVAVQWQQASGGDWAAYAADVSQRK